jgi:geranylgeranyl reductase family protein
MSDLDAIVVGAGPAGCTAAMVLAAGGRSVALLERAQLPRYKACGGGVVWRAMESLPCRPPTPEDIPMLPLHRVVVQYRDSAPVVVERRRPPVNMVMRADFDLYLADRAREAGADLRAGAPLRRIRREGDMFLCETDGGVLQAPVVIGADGAESRVAAHVPGAGAARFGVALEGELRTTTVPQETRFDFAVLPEGYGWVFPKKDGASVGVFSRRSRFPSLRRSYNDYVAERKLAGVPEDRLTGHRIPVAPRRVRGHGGLLLAGDAAGLADPLTGEGISFAIRSGRAAGEAVLRAGPEPLRAAPLYETEIAGLIAEIRLAGILANLLYLAPGGAFGLLGRRAAFAEAIVDVFSGKRTYRELVGRALRRPWRLIA